MLVDEKIEITITNNFKKYYQNKDYDIPSYRNPKVIIKTEDLPDGSNIRINVKCDVCGKIKTTMFKEYKEAMNNYGYYTCHGKCSREKYKQANLEKYGVENPMQSDTIKKKSIQTNLERYGVEHPLQSDIFKNKTKQTNLEKYGVEYPFMSPKILEKSKQTNLEKYGVEHPLKLNSFKNKSKQTNLEKYGVENPMQSDIIKKKAKKTLQENFGVGHPMHFDKIFLKQQKSGFNLKYYKNTNINYRGSYELDFLTKYYNEDLNNGPTIRYNFEDKNKIYFPDFYYEPLNLIIEIKSSYTYQKELSKNLAKQKTCLEQGYDFIFVINKDYSELDKKLN